MTIKITKFLGIASVAVIAIAAYYILNIIEQKDHKIADLELECMLHKNETGVLNSENAALSNIVAALSKVTLHYNTRIDESSFLYALSISAYIQGRGDQAKILLEEIITLHQDAYEYDEATELYDLLLSHEILVRIDEARSLAGSGRPRHAQTVLEEIRSEYPERIFNNHKDKIQEIEQIINAVQERYLQAQGR